MATHIHVKRTFLILMPRVRDADIIGFNWIEG